ncbi:MAG: hypothetical protein R3300_10740 [Candidatus Promineifilaceae bacterium]|nr:hypothetical protein [Candidatus Promineifilaceae bacterium]
MTARTARRLIVAVWALTMIVFLVDIVAIIAGREATYQGWGVRGYPALVGAMYGTVGLIIVRQRPFHLVGWLAMLAAFLSTVQTGLFEFALYAFELVSEPLPGALFVAWFLNWYWVPVVFIVIVVVLYFPDGRLPSRRWRPLLAIQMVLVMFTVGVRMVALAPLDSSLPYLINPYGQAWAADALVALRNASSALFLLLATATALGGLVVRWQRASIIERQQIKWLLYAMVLAMLTLPAAVSNSQLIQAVTQFALAMVPVAIGIAIVRYRLYDIDLIIRRTAVYLIITVTLAATYFGVVVVLQQVLRALTGQESPLAIVASTLAIAVLFTPLRRRVQTMVDRRFYRRKYDATQALSRFAATARDEVDLERLTAALLQTVDETMQPDRLYLWLGRDDPDGLRSGVARQNGP